MPDIPQRQLARASRRRITAGGHFEVSDPTPLPADHEAVLRARRGRGA